MSASAAPARRITVYHVVINTVLALTVGVSVFAAKAYLFSDQARAAQAGDCLAGPVVTTTVETRAEPVDCTGPAAAYEVAGRVDGTADTASPECDRFFGQGEKFVVYASTAAGGYLLCLRPK